jgi:hypothetical protein
MRARSLFALAVALSWLAAAVPLEAHHSFAAEFDANKPVTVVGTVTKVEWTNPHARVYVDVKDPSGKIVNWDFELAGPNGLMRRGWRRDSLKAGQPVTVTGYAAKNAPYVGNATAIILSDGKKMFAGSSFESSPQR